MPLEYWWNNRQQWSTRKWIRVLSLLMLPCLVISVKLGLEKPLFLLIPAILMILAAGAVLAVRKPVLASLFIILVNENILYFFNRSSLRYIYDLKQLLGVVLFVTSIFFIAMIMEKKMLFKWQIVLLLAYQVLAMMVASVNLQQPLLKSIYASYIPLVLSGYFVMLMLAGKCKDYKMQLTRGIIILATIGSAVYIAQFLLYDQVIFLFADFRFRYGSVRFSEPSMFLALSIFLTLSQMFEEKGTRRIYLFISFIMQAFVHVFISKGRMVLIGLIFSLMILLVLRGIKLHGWQLYLIIVLFSGLAGYAAMNMETQQQTSHQVMNDEGFLATIKEVTTFSGNFGVRTDAASFYLDRMQGHWLLGQGLINQDNPVGYYASGKHLQFYIVDVGFIGYLYQYGLIGLLLAFAVLLKGFVLSIQIYLKDNRRYWLIGFFILVLFISPTVFLMQEANALLFLALAFVFIDLEHREVMGT